VGPAWFPDVGSVLVTLRDPQKSGVGYYRFDLANGKAEMLLRTVAYPDIQGWALSPDGKAIFYSESSSGEAPRLMRFDIETRRETELRKGEWVLEMAVSPDSKQLAYLVTADNSTSYLALQPADGGPEREVFRDSPWNGASRHGGIAWTPDQRYLVYPRDDRELWRVPVEGGKAERIGVHTGGGQQFSPDGRRLFFWENNSQGGEVWALENFLAKAAVR